MNNDSEDTELTLVQFPTLYHKVLPGDEIAKGIIYLNSKQMKFISVVHTWSKDYVKYDEGMILNQGTYVFHAVEGQVNLVYLK